MKGYTQINIIYANKLHRRPANQYESDFSMTYKVHDTNLLLVVFLDFSCITLGHMKQLTHISKSLHFSALSSSDLDKFSMFYSQMTAL